MSEPQMPVSLWLAFGLPLAATFAWFILFFLRPRPYVPHPDELDDDPDDEDGDHSPPSSLSESSSAPTAGSSTTAPGTGESGPNG